jgi:hypothetical protein
MAGYMLSPSAELYHLAKRVPDLQVVVVAQVNQKRRRLLLPATLPTL